jgi:hypothetical protein
MKIIATTLVLSALFFGAPVMAGGGHDHGYNQPQPPVNKAVAEENSGKVIASLVERNKVDESWASITASSAEKKSINGKTEWVVTYINESIADTAKQKLYIFLTHGGEYIAVNHTGN